MPISLAALQVYDQYLTTYGSKRSTRYDTHDSKELKYLYSKIQKKNRFAPIYLNAPTSDDITYAVNLKEQAKSLHETIDSLSGDDEAQLFSTKTAYSSNEELASVSYEPDGGETVSSYNNIPTHFNLSIESAATPQRTTSEYLPADEAVEMPAGSYSFDLLTGKLHYELQFELQPQDTNERLQQRLARLINHSDLSVHAEVLHDGNDNAMQSALQISSDALGVPLLGRQHFTITDENTSHARGIVDYLGLNHSTQSATNAVYSVDGQEYTAYSNHFKVYDAYDVTLHPESLESGTSTDVEMGLYSDPQSLSYNLQSFVKSYNSFIACTQTQDGQIGRLGVDMHKLLALHRSGIEQYGIEVGENDTLTIPSTVSADTARTLDTSALQSFGSHLIKKLNTISLDPMEYLNRTVCAYANPASKGFVNPYMTSIYSGMLFNSYI